MVQPTVPLPGRYRVRPSHEVNLLVDRVRLHGRVQLLPKQSCNRSTLIGDRHRPVTVEQVLTRIDP